MSSRQNRILLVEDEFITAQAESQRLAAHGFDVSYVLSGEEAINAAKEASPPDLVLMDLLLGPGMGGHETAREILKLRDIPIIFLTSHNEQEIVDRVREIPHYGYVMKNSGEFTLVSTIEAALSRHQVLSALRVDHACMKEMAREINSGVCRAGDDYDRSLVDYMLNGFVEVIDGDILHVADNEDAAAFFGRTRESMVQGFGRKMGMPREHLLTWIGHYHESREKNRPVRFEYSHHAKDGEHWLLVTVNHLETPPGRNPRFCYSVQDLTNLKQMEMMLREANNELELFKKIIHTSNEAIAVSNADGTLLYINPAHEKLFGRSLEEANRLNYREYYPPESVEILDQLVAPALARGESWEGVLKAYTADRRLIDLWERADSILNHDGTLNLAFGLMHDETERMEAAERLKTALMEKELLSGLPCR